MIFNMKKKFLIGAAIICAAVANLMVGLNTPSESSDLMLQNIESVGVSAGEAHCDASNMNPCSPPGGGSSTGALTVWN